MNIPQTPFACQSSLERDTGSSRWDEAKRSAEVTAWLYRGHDSAKVRRWGERISACGRSLVYLWEKSPEGWSRRLKSARLCRVRTCPICQWRRSLRLQTDIQSRLDVISKNFPKLRPVMLTLTVRNCVLGDLRETVREMLHAWSKLTRRVSFRGVHGWIRSVEVTPGKRGPGFAHPHIHALLLVDETWGEKQLERDLWVEEWAAVSRIDYKPIVDIRPVTSPAGIIEVLKYCVKTADYAHDPQWLPSVAMSLDRLRVFAAGGLIRVAEPDIEDEEERRGEFVEKPPVVPGVRVIKSNLTIVYLWNSQRRRYLRCVHLVDNPYLYSRLRAGENARGG